MANNIGKITQIIGAVLDIKYGSAYLNGRYRHNEDGSLQKLSYLRNT